MIRPEVKEKLAKITEPTIWAIGILIFTWIAINLAITAHWLVVVLPVLIALTCAIAFWNAITKLRLASDGQGKGVVLIDERRVGHFGANDGGFVDFDALVRVEIHAEDHAKVWVLFHEDGPPLEISENAPGADQLLDMMTVLPGIKFSRITEALGDTTQTDYVVWEKSTAPKPPSIQ